MFTPDQRARIRSDLLEFAAADPRIRGAAITGSAAEDREDCWSDIDLAFGIGESAALPDVLRDFTGRMYDRHAALDHVDVHAGAWLYRVFLLAGSLQVDLAFVRAAEFRPLAPSFRLVSGEAREPVSLPTSDPRFLIGMAWLYALHARSSLARGQPWQAEYMISGVRDHALALACLRHGLPTAHGRGFDQLPAAALPPFREALVGSLDPPELARALRGAVEALAAEVRFADRGLAERLEPALRLLASGASIPS